MIKKYRVIYSGVLDMHTLVWRAGARGLAVSPVTADQKIIHYPHVKTVW